MPSQGRDQQATSLQRKVGIGAKSLDRDLDDIHNWPHSYYLTRQCNGVGGWVRLKYSCVDVGTKCAGAKSTIWWRKRLVPPSSFILHGPSASPDPLCSPDPYPAPISARSFSSYPALLRPPLTRNCRLPQTLFRFRNCVGCASEIASDAHPLLSCNLIVEY